MRSLQLKHLAVGPVLALAGVTLILPLSSHAAGTAPPAPTTGPPRASTGGTTHVTATSVTLGGGVNPHGLETTYYFQYGPTDAYGQQTTPATLSAGTIEVKISQTATGLLSGYHYRLVATNSAGTKTGHDRVFTTTSKKTEFELPKTYKPTPLGGTFLLNGTLTGTSGADREIVLQASPYPYTSPYTNVGTPIVTTATGHFTFSVARLTTSTKLRVATVGVKPIYSLIVPALVSVHVTFKVRSSSVKGLVRLYGTVNPAEVGAHVVFQLEQKPESEESFKTTEKVSKLENPAKEKGKSGSSEEKGPTFKNKFTTIVKPGTKSISRFSAVVSISDAGRYRAFVAVRPGALVGGHSDTIALRAAPSTKKKKKEKKEKEK
jgi:hypothetical protein